MLEKQEDNMTSESDESFLLSILMQKEDSRGNIGLCWLHFLALCNLLAVQYTEALTYDHKSRAELAVYIKLILKDWK